MVVGFSGYLVYLSYHRSNELSTKGPLRLSLLGTLAQSNRATKPQLEARAQLFSLSPAIHDSGVQNDKMFRLVNTGGRVVMFNGYNLSAPWYTIKVKRHGEWSVMPMNYTTAGVKQQPQLKAGESLEFPVIVPEGAESWRVGLLYDESAPSNKVTRLADRALSFLRRPPRSRYKPFMVWSDEIPQ